MTYFEAFWLLIGGFLFGREAVKIGVRVWRMMFGSRVRGTVVFPPGASDAE